MADLVAKTGQVRKSLAFVRDNLMHKGTTFFPSIQQYIFQKTVSYTLGGNNSTLHWLPAFNHI